MEVPDYDGWEDLFPKIIEKIKNQEPIPENVLATFCSEQEGVLVKSAMGVVSLFLTSVESRPRIAIGFWEYASDEKKYLRSVEFDEIKISKQSKMHFEHMLDYYMFLKKNLSKISKREPTKDRDMKMFG